jgi:hypothetical protein
MSDVHSSLNSSLTDMMTSLMVIFVLLLVHYLGSKQDEVKAAQSKTELMKEELVRNFQLARIDGIDFKNEGKYTLIVIVPEDKLQFEVGNNQLNSSANDFLHKFIPALLDAYMVFKDDVSFVNVEGHSDPKLKRDAANEYYNWDLSQERASAVMKFIFNLNKGSEATELFKKKSLFGGRGPIECDHGSEAEESIRKRCRTVKFKIRMKSSEEAQASRNP